MGANDSDPLLDLLFDEELPPLAPARGRFGLMLVAGLALIGVAAVALSALEGAVGPAPGAAASIASRTGDFVPSPDTSVAHYERARASR